MHLKSQKPVLIYRGNLNRVDKLCMKLKGFASNWENFAVSTSLISEFVHRSFCHTNLPLLEKSSTNNLVKGIENVIYKL